jgi:hypothetical protein
MSALDELIDQDELREQVIERAAAMAVARWRPTDDKAQRRVYDEALQCRVDEMVKDAILADMRKPVANAIHQALNGEFQPTDAYGAPRSGPKKTLRELIAVRVEEQVKLPENRNGYSSGRSDTALGEWLSREVSEKVKKQLWADFQAIADAVSESAAEAIQNNLKYLLKVKAKR